MANSLFKTIGHNSIADAVYDDITKRTSRYYHFFGKTNTWINEPTPRQIVDSMQYDKEVRNEMIAMKEIAPSDVAYVISRKDWVSGQVYDSYDDAYSSQIIGLNIVSGGAGIVAPVITIGSPIPLLTAVSIVTGNPAPQYYYSGYLYEVVTAGITASVNTTLGTNVGYSYSHGTAVLKCVGYQATATATLGTGSRSGTIISVTMTNKGYGYNSLNNAKVTVTYSSQTAVAYINPIMAVASSGQQKLELSNFYVYYAPNNSIYICVNNNGGGLSTVAPYGTSSSIISTSDGYQWKYMSTIQTGNKFLTADFMPVYTTTKKQIAPTGSIVGVSIDNPGFGYAHATEELLGNSQINAGERYFYLGNVFKVTKSVISATSIVNGQKYTIVTLGTTPTDYTAIGASSNTVGVTFTATGIITVGSGTVSAWTPPTLSTTFPASSIVGATRYTIVTLGTTDYTTIGAPSNTVGITFTSTGTGTGTGTVRVGLDPIIGNTTTLESMATVICEGSLTKITLSGNGTGAVLTPMVTNGAITDVSISSSGKNYSYANLTVSGTGSNAALSASFLTSSLSNSNQTYSESGVKSGYIVAIKMISNGASYSNTDTLTVTITGDGVGSGGIGTTATATATISGGVVSKITMVDRGQGYSWANVTITGGSGYGATARVVLSPYGGLGKDPINQLFARSLMFYSSINYNKNQNVSVVNDYRQIGIIKNPLRSTDSLQLTSNFASCCWKLTATAIITGMTIDSIITSYSAPLNYNFQYRIEAISGSDILVVPIDSGIPTVGSSFSSDTASFTVSSLVPPAVDKYSGDLMLVDNETSFLGTSAAIRTVLNF